VREKTLRTLAATRHDGAPDIESNTLTKNGAIMRPLILLSTAVLLAGCADDQHSTTPTAPRSTSSSGITASNDAAASTQVVSNQGKPSDAVGFTKIVVVTSPEVLLPALQGVVVHADCPAGTTITGGGYSYNDLYYKASAPVATLASIPQYNGWWISVFNQALGAVDQRLTAYALCAS
jgi:hypothetical protein